MNIAIISDTHDNSPAVVWIIEYLNEHHIEVALHAGDIINPGILMRFRDHYLGHLHFVFGNNDGEMARADQAARDSHNMTCHLQEMRLELLGKKIFMNHYSTISESVARGQEFDICIGGHDHKYRVIHHEKSIFINPGNTVTKDKWITSEENKESSFVILNLETMETQRVLVPHNPRE